MQVLPYFIDSLRAVVNPSLNFLLPVVILVLKVIYIMFNITIYITGTSSYNSAKRQFATVLQMIARWKLEMLDCNLSSLGKKGFRGGSSREETKQFGRDWEMNY